MSTDEDGSGILNGVQLSIALPDAIGMVQRPFVHADEQINYQKTPSKPQLSQPVSPPSTNGLKRI